MRQKRFYIFKRNTMRRINRLLAIVIMLAFIGCEQTKTNKTDIISLPYSDSTNVGNWVINDSLSDEFNGSELNIEKWFVQGTDSVYASHWIGRAPSQFSTNNVRVEEGMLKLETKWDTTFNFATKLDYSFPEESGQGRKYENVTTAAVICKNEFLHGYMEIRCKAANASVTSSFWALGSKSELDVFEFVGNPNQPEEPNVERRFQSNVIDWHKLPEGVERKKWRGVYFMDWRPADAFHVYGCDWSSNGCKFYADGKLIQQVTADELGKDWVLTGPLKIWVDSETFPWEGLPTKDELPADFEIDYIRVWQKKSCDNGSTDLAIK